MYDQENLRMFPGNQVHPFFVSLKAGKKSEGDTQSAERGRTVGRKKSGTDCNPIHVYEIAGVWFSCHSFMHSMQKRQRKTQIISGY